MDDRELLAFTDVFKMLGNKEPSNQFEMQAVLAQIRTTKGHLSEDTLRSIETLDLRSRDEIQQLRNLARNEVGKSAKRFSLFGSEFV